MFQILQQPILGHLRCSSYGCVRDTLEQLSSESVHQLLGRLDREDLGCRLSVSITLSLSRCWTHSVAGTRCSSTISAVPWEMSFGRRTHRRSSPPVQPMGRSTYSIWTSISTRPCRNKSSSKRNARNWRTSPSISTIQFYWPVTIAAMWPHWNCRRIYARNQRLRKVKKHLIRSTPKIANSRRFWP